MNEITAFIAAAAQAATIAKTAIQARDDIKRQQALSELTEAFAELNVRHLAVIQEQSALLQKNEELARKLAAYDQWEKEKARYLLCNVGPAALVRALDPSKAGGEAIHWLCTHCYEGRKKGYLHRHGKVINHYKCDCCGFEIDALSSYPNG